MKLKLPLVTPFLYSFVIVLQLLATPVVAQLEHYKARKSYSYLSSSFTSQMGKMLRDDFKRMKKSEHPLEVSQINAARRKNLMQSIGAKMFIQDDTLETLANGILMKIVTENGLTQYPRRILVSRDPFLNASCFGRGLFVITIGMLGRAHNEHQLAFAISHEIAHDELDHIRTKILSNDNHEIRKKAIEKTSNTERGVDISESELDELRKLIYDVRRFSRRYEMQADSFAIVLMQKAGYDVRQSSSALRMLKPGTSPKYNIGANLYMPLNLDNYPLKKEWLNDRGYAERTSKYLGISQDSLETHPDIDLRLKAVAEFLEHSDFPVVKPTASKFALDVIAIAEFETLKCAYDQKEYVLALYYGLQLLDRYPGNPFLIAHIADMLIWIHEWKANSAAIPKSYYRYTLSNEASEELQLLNTILANLSVEESGELAYHFISNKNNFNEAEKGHYYLRHKICQMTYRDEESAKIREDFRKRFSVPLSLYSYK